MDPTLIPAETALEMATLYGARAVLLDEHARFSGDSMRADLTLYDIDGPEWVPRHDYRPKPRVLRGRKERPHRSRRWPHSSTSTAARAGSTTEKTIEEAKEAGRGSPNALVLIRARAGLLPERTLPPEPLTESYTSLGNEQKLPACPEACRHPRFSEANLSPAG
jgi:hypothetical protein